MRGKVFTGLIVAVAGAVLFSVTGCSRMYWHKYEPEKRAACMVERISKKLDLTREQHAKLVQIKDEIMAKRGEFKPLKNALFDEIIKQTKSDKADQAEINRRIDPIEAKAKELRPFLVSKFAEFHAMLTPEQRNKLAKELEEHRTWREK